MLRLLINYLIGREIFENKDSHGSHNNPEQKIVIGDRAYDLNFLRQKMSSWLDKEEHSILYNHVKRSFYVTGTTTMYCIDDVIGQITAENV